MFRASRKGFGSAVSTLILFIAVIGVSLGLVVAMQNYTIETQESLDVQNKVVNNQLRTAIDISNINYDSGAEEIYVYVKNLGQTRLEAEDFSFFVDGVYISEFSFYSAGNLSESQNLFSPGETVVFVTNLTLSSGTHEVKMVSNYGGSGDSDYINI